MAQNKEKAIRRILDKLGFSRSGETCWWHHKQISGLIIDETNCSEPEEITHEIWNIAQRQLKEELRKHKQAISDIMSE